MGSNCLSVTPAKAGVQVFPGAVDSRLRGNDTLEVGMPPYALTLMGTLQLSGQHQRSAYDSAYLALAESQGLWFFTGDKRLFNAVRQSVAWVKWIGDYQFDAIPVQTGDATTEGTNNVEENQP